MRGLRWTISPVVALVVSCGENQPNDVHVLPTGVYSHSIGMGPEGSGGWGPAISLPAGQLEIHQATPDSLVIGWITQPPESYPDTPQVARFIDGAYQVKVVGQPWTVDYRFWLDEEGVKCEADLTPEITESTSCHLERIADLETTVRLDR